MTPCYPFRVTPRPENKRKAGTPPPAAHRFQKGQSGNPGGRKPKTVQWKDAEDALREALPRLLLMRKNELAKLLQDSPTGAEVLAAKFLMESPKAAVERFLGKMPQALTGAEGKPLIPEGTGAVTILPQLDFDHPLWTEARLDAFIAATAAGRAPAAAPTPTPPSAAPAPTGQQP